MCQFLCPASFVAIPRLFLMSRSELPWDPQLSFGRVRTASLVPDLAGTTAASPVFEGVKR